MVADLTLDTNNETGDLDLDMNTTAATITANMSTTVQLPPEFELIIQLYFWLFGILLCIISFVGLTTNVVNIYALSKTVMTSKRPMYHFLLCMAIVDSLVS